MRLVVAGAGGEAAAQQLVIAVELALGVIEIGRRRRWMSAPMPADWVSSWLTWTCAAAICASAWASAIRIGARIDPEQHVAAPHPLVLADQHLGDRPRHFGRDARPCPAGHRHCRSKRSGPRSARNSRRCRAGSAAPTASAPAASAAAWARASLRARPRPRSRAPARVRPRPLPGGLRLLGFQLGVRFAHDACSMPCSIWSRLTRMRARTRSAVSRSASEMPVEDVGVEADAHRLELGEDGRRLLGQVDAPGAAVGARRGAARPARPPRAGRSSGTR